MLKSKTSTAESFIALGGIVVDFKTCFIAGTPKRTFLKELFFYFCYYKIGDVFNTIGNYGASRGADMTASAKIGANCRHVNCV